VASLSQGRTAAAQCGLFTYKSVPVIFEPPCMSVSLPEPITLCLHDLAGSGIFQNTMCHLPCRTEGTRHLWRSCCKNIPHFWITLYDTWLPPWNAL